MRKHTREQKATANREPKWFNNERRDNHFIHFMYPLCCWCWRWHCCWQPHTRWSLFDGELCIYFTSIFSELKWSGRFLYSGFNSFFCVCFSERFWFCSTSFLVVYFDNLSIFAYPYYGLHTAFAQTVHTKCWHKHDGAYSARGLHA